MDREYSEENEREAAGVAFLILSRAQYSPQALVDFWQRAAQDGSLNGQFDRLSRNLSLSHSATMLEEVILAFPEGDHQVAKKSK